jgi:hypothetical protein
MISMSNSDWSREELRWQSRELYIERGRPSECDVVLPPHINDSPDSATAPDCSSSFEKEMSVRIELDFIELPTIIEFVDDSLGKHSHDSEPRCSCCFAGVQHVLLVESEAMQFSVALSERMSCVNGTSRPYDWYQT